MLAFAMMRAVRCRANRSPPPKRQSRPHQAALWSAGRSRRSGALPRGWRSGAFGPPTSSPGRSGAVLIRPPRATPISSANRNC